MAEKHPRETPELIQFCSLLKLWVQKLLKVKKLEEVQKSEMQEYKTKDWSNLFSQPKLLLGLNETKNFQTRRIQIS